VSPGSADLPDHSGPGDLDEWPRAICEAPRKSRVGRPIQQLRRTEPGIRVGLPEVAHRAVIHEVCAIIGSEFQVHRAVDAPDAVNERLLERRVVSKPLEVELERLTRLAEVDELNVVPLFGCAIGLREPEISLAAGQGRTALDRAVDERIGYEVEAHDRDVRSL